MQTSNRAIRWYAIALTLVVNSLLLTTQPRARAQSLGWSDGLLAAGLGILIAVAGRFPLHISSKTKFVVDTGLMFTALLIFPSPLGPLVAGMGALLGLLIAHSPMLDTTINLSAVVLQCLVAQWVYYALGGMVPARFESPLIAWPIAAAAMCMIFVEGLLISLAVSLYQGTHWLQTFINAWRRAFKEDIALILLGVLTVLVVRIQPWALFLTAIPLVLVYLALRNSLRMQAVTRDAVESLADLIDRRDPYTAGHSARVAVLAERLAIEIGLPWEEYETIRAAARVHDLGKIGIDAMILSKPAHLNPEELVKMRHHPEAGAEIITRFPEFACGAEYVRHHHERWDGQGYPSGLKGDRIPQGARIIAVADAYDAMTSDRPYRRALSPELVFAELKRGGGVQWDERIVSTLLTLIEHDHVEHHRGVALPATVNA